MIDKDVKNQFDYNDIRIELTARLKEKQKQAQSDKTRQFFGDCITYVRHNSLKNTYSRQKRLKERIKRVIDNFDQHAAAYGFEGLERSTQRRKWMKDAEVLKTEDQILILTVIIEMMEMIKNEIAAT